MGENAVPNIMGDEGKFERRYRKSREESQALWSDPVCARVLVRDIVESC